MTAKRSTDPTRQLSPIRVAPIGELTAYTVLEHELDIIAAGSPATLAFNFAVALISIGVSFALTLSTTSIGPDRLFHGYLIACINCLALGVFMFIYWLKTRTSVDAIVAKIKGRMVLPEPIQEPPTGDRSPPSA